MSTTPDALAHAAGTLLGAVVPPETTDLERSSLAMLREATALVVCDAASCEEAADYAKLAALMERQIHELLDPICQAADRAHKVAVDKRTALLRVPLEVKRLAGQKATDWQREQERRRRQAEEEQQRERERLEAAEEARIAEERLRLLREAEERQLAEAMAKEAAGDLPAMEQILAAPPEPIAPPVARPVFVPPVAVEAPPKIAGLTARMDWDFVITDEAAIPREYLTVNDVAIRKVCRALKGNTRIPGIRAVEKPVTAVRP